MSFIENATQSDEEQKLAEILVEALDLEDVPSSKINPTAPLFGTNHEHSLGLDSIDALEISLAIAQNYGVQIKADDENNLKIFSSLRTLAEYANSKSN